MPFKETSDIPPVVAQAKGNESTFADKARQEVFLQGNVERHCALPNPSEKRLIGKAQIFEQQNMKALLDTYRGPVISGYYKLSHEELAKLYANTPELSSEASWHMNFITVPKNYPLDKPFSFYAIQERYLESRNTFLTSVDTTARLEGSLVDDKGTTYFVGTLKFFIRGHAQPSGQLENFWVPLVTQYDHSSDEAIVNSQRKRWLEASKQNDKWAHDDREKVLPPLDLP